MFGPLEVGAVELEGEGGGGEGREGEVELQHVSSLSVLGWLILLVENGGCKGKVLVKTSSH